MVINFDVDNQLQSELKLDEPLKMKNFEFSSVNLSLIDSSNKSENLFFHEWQSVLYSAKNLRYYTIEAHLAYKLEFVTLETFFLGLRTVEHVLKTPELHSKFCLPDWVWPIITENLTSIFEGVFRSVSSSLQIAIKGNDVKVVSIKGDSTKDLYESIFHSKHCELSGINIGKSSSDHIYHALITHAKNAIDGFVHIFIENNPVHEYTAFFLQTIVKDLGYDSKIVYELDFYKNNEGKFVDSDGTEIKLI